MAPPSRRWTTRGITLVMFVLSTMAYASYELILRYTALPTWAQRLLFTAHFVVSTYCWYTVNFHYEMQRRFNRDYLWSYTLAWPYYIVRLSNVFQRWTLLSSFVMFCYGFAMLVLSQDMKSLWFRIMFNLSSLVITLTIYCFHVLAICTNPQSIKMDDGFLYRVGYTSYSKEHAKAPVKVDVRYLDTDEYSDGYEFHTVFRVRFILLFYLGFLQDMVVDSLAFVKKLAS